MANGYQFPYGFQQGNLLTAQRPTATGFYQAAQQGKFGLPKRYEPQSSMLSPTMAAIAARTTQPLATPTSIAMPAAPLARSRVLQGQQGGVPLPQPRPESMPPSGLDQLRAAQLRMPARGTPADAGLRAAAATGLQLSGYQDRPITMGQGLGAMLGAYTESEQAAADRQAAAQATQREIEQQDFANALKLMELEAAGIKRLKDQETEQLKAEGETAKDIAKYTNELADDFRTENKEFESAFTSYRKVANAATKTDPTGADDIALIFGFMKVLDPNSVVREGEFATAQNSGSVPQSILAVYNQVLSGQRLTTDQRTNFLNAAKDQFSPYVELRNRLEDRYSNRAKGLGVNVNNVYDRIVGNEQFVPKIVETLEQGDALPSGTFYTVRGSGEIRKVD